VQVVEVVFEPGAEEGYAGTLIIESNGRASGVVEVPMIGTGTANRCPVAVAGDGEPLRAQPRDVVVLDGSGSTDPDGPGGRPVTYEWTVVAAPPGAAARLVEGFFDAERPADGGPPDDSSTPAAMLFVPLAGAYLVELRVVDAMDLASPSQLCPAPHSRAHISVGGGDEGVHVELVWDTPGDPDQTDMEGSDVDLHLLHPTARAWNVAPQDCYYANTQPDWGAEGPGNNPRFLLDDVDGAGPELLVLAEPEDTVRLGGPYRLGVHYYRANNLRGGTWGPSDATVRVSVGDELVWEFRRELLDTGHFWEAAAIHYEDGELRVAEVNAYHDALPEL